MSLYLLASKVNSSRCHGRCDVQYREVICSDSTAFARNCLCMCNIRACSRQWFLFHASVYCARLVQPRRHKPHEANPVRQSRWLQVTSRDEQTQGKHGIELRVVESSSSLLMIYVPNPRHVLFSSPTRLPWGHHFHASPRSPLNSDSDAPC